jgi:hypothetical protein
MYLRRVFDLNKLNNLGITMNSYSEIKKLVPVLLDTLRDNFGLMNAISMLEKVDLTQAFIPWESTSQGHKYWKTVHTLVSPVNHVGPHVNSIDDIIKTIPRILGILQRSFGEVKAKEMLQGIQLPESKVNYPEESSEAIYHFCLWSGTPQGVGYWAAVTKFIKFNEAV